MKKPLLIILLATLFSAYAVIRVGASNKPAPATSPSGAASQTAPAPTEQLIWVQ